jgi:four helix bundle protein
MEIRSYRDLIVWQKSMQLVTEIYLLAKNFPKEEIYGLTSQIKRAVISVPSNIAEGQGRDSTREFIHHLSIAYGSLMEVETQLQIAVNLNFVEQMKINEIYTRTSEIGRLINGLSRSLQNKLKGSI